MITSKSNQEYDFYITNNEGVSSSIYKPTKLIKTSHGFKVKEVITLKSTSISDVLNTENWNNVKFDLVVDVQGAELEVLKGFKKQHFNNIRHLQIEQSSKRFYEGGVLFDELNAYLVDKGFVLQGEKHGGHGDVYYINTRYVE